MTALVVFALPLLTAVCAWLIFLHLARSGNRVQQPTPADIAVRFTARTREFSAAFALMAEATRRATASFQSFSVELERAMARERALRDSKARASERGDA